MAGSRSSKSSSTPAGACSPGRVEPLVRGVAGELEHLGGDAVEHHRVALLVAALQVEDPGHQGVVGRLAERRDVLGDGVLCHAEAGEQRGQALAALVGELGPRGGVGSEVDGPRIPLQPGHEPREEVGPLGRREQVAGSDLLLGETKPCRGIEREIPRLPVSHGGTIPSGGLGQSRRGPLERSRREHGRHHAHDRRADQDLVGAPEVVEREVGLLGGRQRRARAGCGRRPAGAGGSRRGGSARSPSRLRARVPSASSSRGVWVSASTSARSRHLCAPRPPGSV